MVSGGGGGGAVTSQKTPSKGTLWVTKGGWHVTFSSKERFKFQYYKVIVLSEFILLMMQY